MSNNIPTYYAETWGDLQWSNWLDAKEDYSFLQDVSRLGGFYRIRAKQKEGLVYVGQTGRNLRERLSALFRNVFWTATPWNDPHTAAPLLWAYRIEDNYEFEVSYAVLETTNKERQCWEDFLLASHRLEFGTSTLCNHGRLHPYWARRSNRSSGKNTRRLKSPRSYPSHPPSSGTSNSSSNSWLGYKWTQPIALKDINASKAAGIYRLINWDQQVIYIGESHNLQKRLKDHKRKLNAGDILASWIELADLEKHQLREIETDLIGSFFRVHRRPPALQYGSSRNPFKDYHQELCRSFNLIMDALTRDSRNDDLRIKLASYLGSMEPRGELHTVLEAITPRSRDSKLTKLYRECSKAVIEHHLPDSTDKALKKIRKAFKKLCRHAEDAFATSSTTPRSLVKFTNKLQIFGDSTSELSLNLTPASRTPPKRKRSPGRPTKLLSENDFAIADRWRQASSSKTYTRHADFIEHEYPHLTVDDLTKILDRVRKHKTRKNS